MVESFGSALGALGRFEEAFGAVEEKLVPVYGGDDSKRARYTAQIAFTADKLWDVERDDPALPRNARGEPVRAQIIRHGRERLQAIAGSYPALKERADALIERLNAIDAKMIERQPFYSAGQMPPRDGPDGISPYVPPQPEATPPPSDYYPGVPYALPSPPPGMYYAPPPGVYEAPPGYGWVPAMPLGPFGRMPVAPGPYADPGIPFPSCNEVREENARRPGPPTGIAPRGPKQNCR